MIIVFPFTHHEHIDKIDRLPRSRSKRCVCVPDLTVFGKYIFNERGKRSIYGFKSGADRHWIFAILLNKLFCEPLTNKMGDCNELVDPCYDNNIPMYLKFEPLLFYKLTRSLVSNRNWHPLPFRYWTPEIENWTMVFWFLWSQKLWNVVDVNLQVPPFFSWLSQVTSWHAMCKEDLKWSVFKCL